MRDEFAAPIKRDVAGRVGLRCSNPDCLAPTMGPRTDEAGTVNVGVAAHITAAAAGGPRFDESLTQSERRSAANSIWLCQTCAKRVDSDLSGFTVQTLRSWKASAESRALLALGQAVDGAAAPDLTLPEMSLLSAAAEQGDMWLIKTNEVDWVRAGSVDFLDERDPMFAADHREALQRLVSRGLVEYRSGILYCLKGSGFRVARALSASDWAV